jgi:hypothetical protein
MRLIHNLSIQFFEISLGNAQILVAQGFANDIGGHTFLLEAIGKTMPGNIAAQLFVDFTDLCNFI